MLDDRFRLAEVSDGFLKMFGVSKEGRKEYLGIPLVKIVNDERYKIRQY